MTAPLRWASPAHRATSFSLSGDRRREGRNKPGAPRPHNHPRSVRPSRSDPATNTEQESDHPPCPLLSTHGPGAVTRPGVEGGLRQPWAPAPQRDCPSRMAKGSAVPSSGVLQPRAAMRQAGAGASRGGTEEVAPQFPCESVRPR